MDESEQDSRFREWYREHQGIIIAVIVCAAVLGFTGWFLSYCFSGRAQPIAPTFANIGSFTESDVAKIDNWLEGTMERSGYPSLSVAIVRDGQIVYQRALGFENSWTRREATTNSAYNVASVTKAFTATLAAILHEQGVVDLDQPVSQYLPKTVVISDTP